MASCKRGTARGKQQARGQVDEQSAIAEVCQQHSDFNAQQVNQQRLESALKRNGRLHSHTKNIARTQSESRRETAK